jgi:hypothetical protein
MTIYPKYIGIWWYDYYALYLCSLWKTDLPFCAVLCCSVLFCAVLSSDFIAVKTGVVHDTNKYQRKACWSQYCRIHLYRKNFIEFLQIAALHFYFFSLSVSSEIFPFAAGRHFSGILFPFPRKYRSVVFHQHNLCSKFNDHIDIRSNFHLNLEEICCNIQYILRIHQWIVQLCNVAFGKPRQLTQSR